jgi:hypothetical protein
VTGADPAWLPFDYVFDRLRERVAGLTDAELGWQRCCAISTPWPRSARILALPARMADEVG